MRLVEKISLLFVKTSTNRIQGLCSTYSKCQWIWLIEKWLSCSKAWAIFYPVDLHIWHGWQAKPAKKHQHGCRSFLQRSMLMSCQPYCEFGFTGSTYSPCTLILTKLQGRFHFFVSHLSVLQLCDREGHCTHSRVQKGTRQTLGQAMTRLQIFWMRLCYLIESSLGSLKPLGISFGAFIKTTWNYLAAEINYSTKFAHKLALSMSMSPKIVRCIMLRENSPF